MFLGERFYICSENENYCRLRQEKKNVCLVNDNMLTYIFHSSTDIVHNVSYPFYDIMMWLHNDTPHEWEHIQHHVSVSTKVQHIVSYIDGMLSPVDICRIWAQSGVQYKPSSSSTHWTEEDMYGVYVYLRTIGASNVDELQFQSLLVEVKDVHTLLWNNILTPKIVEKMMSIEDIVALLGPYGHKKIILQL
jgi:hypothetical protein